MKKEDEYAELFIRVIKEKKLTIDQAYDVVENFKNGLTLDEAINKVQNDAEYEESKEVYRKYTGRSK